MTVASTFRGKTSEGTIKTATKGDRTVTTLVMGPDADPMAGVEVRTIADRKANTLTTLTPMPAGTTLPPAITGGVESKGIKMVEPLSDQSDLGGMSLDAKPDIRKLGTSQTIAGMSCAVVANEHHWVRPPGRAAEPSPLARQCSRGSMH